MATRPEIERSELPAVHGQPDMLSLPASGPVIVPGGGLMTDAVFARVDGDLLIELADGSRLIVRDYFNTTNPPPLATDAGAHIGSDVVSALAGVDAAAIPTVSSVGAPIGRVETVSGDVEIIHADGTRIDAEAGTLLARGDRIETGAGANAGMLFADESTFAVGGHARATLDDLVFDPDSGAQHATFIVQQGTFSFSGGGIAQHDGAFVIKTPAATISVDGASGAGRVEADGGTMVTYLRADDVGHGAIRVENPGGAEVLDNSYEALTVDDYFSRPSGVLRLGPRDAAEHYGDAITALPDAHAIMPDSLLAAERGADPASRALAQESGESGEAGFGADSADGPELENTVQVDRDTAFEIAARKAAIARAARDAADEALRDASEAEKAARAQAAEAGAEANHKLTEAEALRAQALDVLAESERRDQAFEQAIRDADQASVREQEAARAVAETDLAETQAAERLAAAEEAVRQALAAAEQARNEALQILEEAKAKEAAFAEAQRLAAAAHEAEEARALAVAEADAAEEAAAAALRAAEAAAQSAARDAEVAERVAQEASTAAEVVETVVERELAAIDPNLLKPPRADDPSSSKGDWITRTNASMNVARAAMDAGEEAAREAYRVALREGSTIEEALERAIIAAEAYGGARAADQVIAAGPDGLIEPGEETGGGTLIAGGGGYTGDSGSTGAIGTDVLIGGAGGDTLGAGGGGGYGGIDGLFGFGFRFTPIVLNLSKKADDDERDDPVILTATAAATDLQQGTALADFIVGSNAATTVGAQEGADFIYGDVPTNLLSGTHNISNTLTNPTFDASGSNDLISGGAGDDSIWGGAGADTIYGDVPDDTSAFGISLGAAGNGADDIYGGDGNDILYGNGGADTLSGEGGDDTFMLGDDDGANDTVWGGDSGADSGTDTVDYSGAGAAMNIDLAAGTATGANTGTDTLSGIENATGSSLDDTISGSASDNSLSGGDGADTLSGLAGADNIFGYAGDDVLIGGEGVDRLTGGTGADQFRFEGGSGGNALARATSLGTDVINDYNASENDLFMLSDADFSLGNAGTLTDSVNYFEADTTSISSVAQNLSGGVANAGIVIIGSANGGDGAEVWYTDNAAAMTDSNSYQIASVTGADRSTLDAGDFNLKS